MTEATTATTAAAAAAEEATITTTAAAAAARTSKYAIEMIRHDLCGVGWMGLFGNFVPMNLPIPRIHIRSGVRSILWLRTSGTCFMDSWTVLLHFDPHTGEILDFGIR